MLEGLKIIAPADKAYRRLITVRNRFDAATATTTTLTEGASGVPSGANGGNAVFYIDPAELAPSGPTPKLNLRLLLVTNAVAPACNFTVGLYPITAAGGAAANVAITLGTLVAGSAAALATPAASSPLTAASGDFDCPAAGFYAIALIISANMAASSSVALRATLLGKAG
jgi:hypothetical protein